MEPIFDLGLKKMTRVFLYLIVNFLLLVSLLCFEDLTAFYTLSNFEVLPEIK